jgi:peroxiredoxin
MERVGLDFRVLAMSSNDIVGSEVPNVPFGYLDNGELKTITAGEFFSGTKAVAIGVSGAYLPVCSHQHVPDFVNTTYKLRMAGYAKLAVIVPNDPFVTAAWSKQVDPAGNLVFLSDGNLELARALGVTMTIRSIFVGERPMRYMFVANKGRIRRFSVEPDILTLSCTGAAHALKAA